MRLSFCFIIQHAAILLGEYLAGCVAHLLGGDGAIAGQLVGELAVLPDELHLCYGDSAVEVVDVVEGAL